MVEVGVVGRTFAAFEASAGKDRVRWMFLWSIVGYLRRSRGSDWRWLAVRGGGGGPSAPDMPRSRS